MKPIKSAMVFRCHGTYAACQAAGENNCKKLTSELRKAFPGRKIKTDCATVPHFGTNQYSIWVEGYGLHYGNTLELALQDFNKHVEQRMNKKFP